jgi:hypothetical protein
MRGTVRLPVLQSTSEHWFIRAALALTLATPLILWSIARAFNSSHTYTFEIEASSSVYGSYQLFYDRGGGITEKESVKMPVHAGNTFETIRLPLSSGTYRLFRIDPPGIDGRYAIARARILDWNSNVVIEIPVASIKPVFQLRVIDAGPPAVYETPPGSNDPQLIWQPASSLVLAGKPGATATLIAQCLGAFSLTLIAVWLLTVAFAPLSKPCRQLFLAFGRAGDRRPHWIIACAALVGTAAAMYPLLFLGKSLVSPNNGGAALLYNRAPFTPGETDLSIEDIRGSDNGAEMWAFVPYSQMQRAAFAQGEIPLWNRYNATGRPLWGQGQTQLLDPLHWVTLVTPNIALGWDLKFLLHRFVFALGTGAAVFVLTASWPSAALIALVAPFASYYLFRLNHPAQFTFTYAAWMMWAWFRLAGASVWRDLRRAVRWLAVTTALVMVGSPPKEAIVVILCGSATGALACLLARRTAGPRLPRFGAAAVAAFVAILLSMPHWLIFATTLRQSLTDYDVPHARFATWPFAQAIAFGALSPGQLMPGAHAMVVALWIAALLGGRYTWRDPVRMAAVTGPLLAFLVAFGAIPASIITKVPLLANIYQIDYAFIGAGLVLLFIAGGVGVAGLTAARPKSMTAITVTCLMGGMVLIARGSGGISALSLFVETWALLFAVVLATMLVLLIRRTAAAWPAPLAAVTCVLAIALIVSPSGLHAVTHVDRIDDQIIQPGRRPDFRVPSPAMEAIHQDNRGPSRTLGLGELLFPGTQALYGVEGIGGPDALELPKYEELINASGVYRYWTWNQLFTAPDLVRLGPLLNLLNVRYLVMAQDAAVERIPAGEGLTMLPQGPDRVAAVRRSGEWPRAFFVDRVDGYGAVAEFVRQMNDANRPFASVDRADQQARALTSNAQSDDRIVVPATNYRLTMNRTRFRIQAPSSGVAVLTESWMADDFIATLNGRRTPYFRVNHAFKGVAIPSAGDWTIEFTYRPKWWTFSLFGAALGVLALGGSFLIDWKARAPTGPLRQVESRR